MANSTSPFQPAIDELEKDLADIERQGNALRSAINVLRAKAGQPPRPDGGGGMHEGASGSGHEPSGGTGPVQIRPDTFFGKKMGTAAREYLSMRRAAGGDGPAKPREIFDAMTAGGFQFDTKDDTVAIISLRNMLRKRTETFQRLPNGTYGLKSWYPDAKQPRKQASPEGERTDEVDEYDDDETSVRPKSSSAA